MAGTQHLGSRGEVGGGGWPRKIGRRKCDGGEGRPIGGEGGGNSAKGGDSL